VLAPADGDAGAPEQAAPPEAAALADRLAAGLARVDDAFAARWRARMAEVFSVVIRQPNGTGSGSWHVDPGTRVLAGADAGDEADWSIVATAQTWLEVLAGRLNLSAALRRNELRYCDFGENDVFVTEARIGLLADLLGLPSLAADPAHVPALAD
jgi:hypothetical protein